MKIVMQEMGDEYDKFEREADKETQKVIDVARKRGLRFGYAMGVFSGAMGATGIWLRADGYRLLGWFPMGLAFVIAIFMLSTKLYEHDPNA